MATIKELNAKIEQMEKEKQAIIADQSIFYTECLKIAIKNNYTELIEYINASPQDMISAKESLLNDIEEEKQTNKTEIIKTSEVKILEKEPEKEVIKQKTIKRPTDLTQFLQLKK